MINDDTYAVYRAAIDKAQAWLDQSGGYRDAIPPCVADVTNAIRGEVEVYELHRDKPAMVTAYAAMTDGTLRGPQDQRGRRGTLTTWPGDTLGTFEVRGKAWQDRHGNWRVSVIASLPGIGRYRGQWVFTAQDCLTLKRIGDA